MDELIKEILSLLSEEHHYKTLVIDPLTTLYNDLIDKSAEKIKRQAKKRTLLVPNGESILLKLIKNETFIELTFKA